MGAGASISDLAELKTAYDKVESSLPEETKKELEDLFNDPVSQKKGEFLFTEEK